MQRISAINNDAANGKAKELLDGVQSKLGMTPNLMKTMAHSPAVLEAYLNFNNTLANGLLSAKLREQISLLTAETNGCNYCASAHTMLGKMAGLSEDAVLAARQADSTDPKSDAALKFAQKLIVNRGEVSDADLQTVKDAGLGEGEIGEIVANVALNIFTNYFNETARTEIDFPAIEFPLASRRAQAG
jgi:uncharacterized peroxidase-related enzyme